MSLITEIHRRAPVPFEYAKARFEKLNQCAVADDHHAFLRFWAHMNYDAAEAFANVARERAEAFKLEQGAAREAVSAAIAAAREAYNTPLGEHPFEGMNRCMNALGDLLAALDAAQPVAWTRTDCIHDDDGRPIGLDEPEVRWQKECPGHHEGWSPLFTSPASFGLGDLVGALFSHNQSRRFRLILEDEADDFEAMNHSWSRVGPVHLPAFIGASPRD